VSYLVEISLQKVDLCLLLQQTRPVLLLEFLLAQHQLDVPGRVVDLALLWLDLGEEVELDVVGCLFRLRVAGEFEVGGLDVQVDLLWVYIGNGDGEVHVVLLWFAGGGALGPGHCVKRCG